MEKQHSGLLISMIIMMKIQTDLGQADCHLACIAHIYMLMHGKSKHTVTWCIHFNMLASLRLEDHWNIFNVHVQKSATCNYYCHFQLGMQNLWDEFIKIMSYIHIYAT